VNSFAGESVYRVEVDDAGIQVFHAGRLRSVPWGRAVVNDHNVILEGPDLYCSPRNSFDESGVTLDSNGNNVTDLNGRSACSEIPEKKFPQSVLQS